MALSDDDKDWIVARLRQMERERAEAVLRSENSFVGWLKRAARWLFDKIADTVVGRVVSWLWSVIFG